MWEVGGGWEWLENGEVWSAVWLAHGLEPVEGPLARPLPQRPDTLVIPCRRTGPLVKEDLIQGDQRGMALLILPYTPGQGLSSPSGGDLLGEASKDQAEFWDWDSPGA